MYVEKRPFDARTFLSRIGCPDVDSLLEEGHATRTWQWNAVQLSLIIQPRENVFLLSAECSSDGDRKHGEAFNLSIRPISTTFNMEWNGRLFDGFHIQLPDVYSFLQAYQHLAVTHPFILGLSPFVEKAHPPLGAYPPKAA